MSKLIGTNPNQVPTNADLGTMAYLDAETEIPRLIGGRRNLIINGDFQVSQRGDYTSATALTAGAFHVDRFKTDVLGAGGTVQVLTNQDVLGNNANTIKINCTSAGTGYLDTIQKIETPAGLQGKTLTLSFYLKSNMNFWIRGGSLGLTPTYHNIGDTNGQWKRVEVQIKTTVGYPTTYIGFGAYDGSNHTISVGDYYEVAMMQLELGSVATPFEHRSYGEELALCQRYFHALVQGGSPYDGYTHVGHAGVNSSTNVTVHVDMPVEMRTYPSISAKSGTTFYLGNNGGSWVWNEAYGWNRNGGRLSFGHASSQSITIYQSRDLYFEGNSGTTNTHALYFDAEL